MKIKLANASDQQLDWLVSRCEGIALVDMCLFTKDPDEEQILYTPSTDWSQAGPIIEREGISLRKEPYGWYAVIAPEGKAFKTVQGFDGSGDTPLIAAMRCYVASKLGDEVEVPEKLL